MRIGLFAYDLNVDDVLELGVAADELGLDCLWLGEHLLRPVDYTSSHPMAGKDLANHADKKVVDTGTRLADPFLLAAAVAARTRRLHVATGVHLLPLRHPLLSARMVATLGELAPARFRFGIGMGWLREEFDSLGIPFTTRVSRFEEAIQIVRQAISGKPLAFSGRHFQFEPVQLTREAVEIPLIMAGNSDKAMRRALTLGDGWLSSGTSSFDDCLRLRDTMEGHREQMQRATPFTCYFHVGACDDQTFDRYRAEGIENLVFTAQDVWSGDTLVQRRERLAHLASSAA